MLIGRGQFQRTWQSKLVPAYGDEALKEL